MFLGQIYRKKTAWDGIATIGVVQVGIGRYAVYWHSKGGNYTPFRTDVLPEMPSRHAAQETLDTYAAGQQLEAA